MCFIPEKQARCQEFAGDTEDKQLEEMHVRVWPSEAGGSDNMAQKLINSFLKNKCNGS